jgi:hypothetical protein
VVDNMFTVFWFNKQNEFEPQRPFKLLHVLVCTFLILLMSLISFLYTLFIKPFKTILSLSMNFVLSLSFISRLHPHSFCDFLLYLIPLMPFFLCIPMFIVHPSSLTSFLLMKLFRTGSFHRVCEQYRVIR